jgi:putative N6-adenine-specific DNA methylase
MTQYRIIATSTFGLESILVYELKALGYRDLEVKDGRVAFSGDARDIARCNILLRTADRVLIEMACFPATDFEELFQGALKVPWEHMVPVDGVMHVVGKSVKSKLFSVRDCQAIVKKAVIEAMKRKYRGRAFLETGPVYKIEVALMKDVASLTVDTTGQGLHKRGYRVESGEAPLRETLAAGLVLLSRWASERTFADPLCGSGTIAIEAALIGKNIAPGLRRSFVSEEWKQVPAQVWQEVRQEARSLINDSEFRILASDRDGEVLKIARKNAERAGVGKYIAFQKLPVEEFSSQKKYGCIICNPPYGERIGEAKEVATLYRTMGRIFSSLDGWSFFILSAHPDFQRTFGRRADRNRKLYNGNLQCYLFEYLGPLPKKKPRVPDDS